MKLIDKAALVAEIEGLKRNTFTNFDEGVNAAAQILLDFLDTLEVKEVDLDFQTFAKEMDAVFDLPSTETTNTEEEPLNWEYAIAKHYFNLGLKAKEGKL